MYTLHIGNKNYSSWSLRPWILMVERGIAFREQLHAFGPSFDARNAAKSPAGKVPCLHDGDTVVWDTISIAEYLAERHPGAWPKDDRARAWARSASAEMHSGFGTLREICAMNCGIRVKLHSQPEPLRKDLARIADIFEEGLQRFGGPFLAGREFTAVDGFFCPVAFRVQSYGLELPKASGAYVKRLLGLGGMKRWYEEALVEPYRDLPHEADMGRYGTITQDLRKPATASA